MRLGFGRRLRHPFFPALKLTPAADVRHEASALCGNFEELCRAAAAGVRVERAVFPVVPWRDPFLDPARREILWALFEVPIYTLVLDADGRIVAYECEGQDGVHLVEGVFPEFPCASLESALCDCGRPGVRLVSSTAADELAVEHALAG